MLASQDPRALAIIREARHQFVSEGYCGARIEPIAREAAVSTATLYAFFESKAVLFEAVLEEAASDFRERIDKVAASGDPSREHLTLYMVNYAQFLCDPFVRKMFRLIIAERQRFPQLASRFFDEGRGNIAQTLIAMVEAMEAKGHIRLDKASWAVGQLLGMVEHPVLLLPLAMGRDPAINRPASDIAQDAVQTFWSRYGV